MGVVFSDRAAYYERLNRARERREEFKKIQRERALKEYAKRNGNRLLSCIVWYKAPGEELKRAKLNEGGTTLRRVLGSVESIAVGESLKVFYNPFAKELGFSENCEVSGIKIYGPAVLCDTRGWEFIDCTLKRDEAESYF